jgi:flagellar motor switch protein FliG
MIATANNKHDTGIRKAAIFVVSLDQATADLLLDQLDPQCAALVREAVMELDNLDADERQRVIDEFQRIGPMVPDPFPPGIELDGPMAAQFMRPESKLSADWNEHLRHLECSRHPDSSEGSITISKEILRCTQNDSSETPEVSSPFSFLREAEEENLAQLLRTERPQTIALVLSHLSSEQAGGVLARFASPLQGEVVRRLVDLENTDPETLRQVEQSLEARLTQQFPVERDHTAGPDAVTRILAACPSHIAGNILDNLADCDPSLAEQLGHRPFQFDDLEQLDDASLLAIFRAAEPEAAQAALVGAPPPLVERILRRMIPKEAQRLRRKLENPGPILLSDIEDSRQRIALLAQQLTRKISRRDSLAA